MPHPASPPSVAPPPEAGALFPAPAPPRPERPPATPLPHRLPDTSRVHRVRLARAERQLAGALVAALGLVIAALAPAFGGGGSGPFPLGTGEAWLAGLTLASGLGLWALGARLRRSPGR